MPKAVDLGVTSVVDVVERLFGVEGSLQGREFKFICVNPRHNESNPSCSVNAETGYWHCFSCGVGGDLAELGVLALKKPRDEVEQLLRPATIEGMVESVRSRLRSVSSVKAPKLSQQRPIGGPYDDGPLTAFRSRGFTQETLKKWGVRFCESETLLSTAGKEFTIRNSIAIPIRDESGQTMAWCYRRTNSSPSWQPRYIYDREVSHLWFGMDQHHNKDEVVIVEGAADAMWLDQCNFPALGLLGAGMVGGKTHIQSKVLRLMRFKSLVLLGDRDAGGEAWVNYIGGKLGTRLPIKVALYSSWMPGSDPQEMLGVDLEIMLARAQPWTRYRQRIRSA